MSSETEPTHPRWLVGLRRAQLASRALERWADDRGVTGAVWDPGSHVAGDASGVIEALVRSGARPDATLLRDLMVTDVRAACRALIGVRGATDDRDGYVAVWMDPDHLVDPGRAAQAARSLVDEIGRPLVAVAFVWTGARAGALSSIVGTGVPVAVSGVSGPAAAAVATARAKGIERLNRDVEEPEDAQEVPVFVLGSRDVPEGLVGIELVCEEQVLRPGAEQVAALPHTQEEERSAWAAAVEALEERSRRPVHDDTYSPQGFADDVAREVSSLDADRVLERIWERDHTVWRPEPVEIEDRLGWLDVARRMRGEAPDLEAFGRAVRAEGVDRLVLLGMGGSSLAPEMFRAILGGSIALEVCDTTDPDHVAALRGRVDPERTLFVVASKSGTTVETRSHLELFWSISGRGDRFVAITDPDSELAAVGAERGFRRVFLNPPDIGGRYSALSLFGLVPAAICGIDVAALLDGCLDMMRSNAGSVMPVAAPGAR
ncbi:MAG TPA: hypothetical protein VM840_02070, partial [Actinomycetota bacterium]|nr:hypothetical protein [Actinomycetota bacterium]